MSRRSRVCAGVVALLLPAAFLTPASPARAEDPDLHTVSGVVSTQLGAIQATDDALGYVEAYDYNGESVASGAINAEGRYSFELPAGRYNFKMSAAAGDNVPPYYTPSLSNTRRDVDVDADTTVNFEDSERPLLVHLEGPDQQPRSGVVELRCTQYQDDWPIEQRSLYRHREVSSYASGSGDLTVTGFAVQLLEGYSPREEGCHLTVYPTDGSYEFRDITISETDPNEITVVIPDPVTVTGHIELPGGVVPNSVEVVAIDPSIPAVVAFPTVPGGDGGGDYRLRLAPGKVYNIDYQAYVGGENNEDDFYSIRGRHRMVQVDDDMVLDASVDTVPVTVKLVDGDGNPVAGRARMDCQKWREGVDNDGYGTSTQVVRSGTGEVTLLGVETVGDWQPCSLRALDPEGGEMYMSGYSVTIKATGNVFTIRLPEGPILAGDGLHNSADQDGVEDLIEAGAPNNGDGNSDDIADFQQPHVTSVPGNGGPPGTPGGDGAGYVTVAGPAGSTLVAVSTMPVSDAASPPPAGVTLPGGLASFTLDDIAPGSTQTVSMRMGSTEGVNGYAKYDTTTNTWSTLPAGRVNVFENRLEITLTDGGVGDDDGTVNGQISDPGGFAVGVAGDTEAPTTTGRATTRPNGFGWYRSNVRIDWTSSDPSGVETQPADTIVSAEGAGVTATSPLVCDKVTPTPNCGRGTLAGLNIDKTAPALSVAGVANGATYTLGNVPTASCAASDALSGLAGPCRATTVGGNSAGVGSFTYATSAVDRAGNVRVAGASYRVVYRFDGFSQPVNDPGPPVSIFKAGSTVPVSFTLKRSNGTRVSPASKPVWVSPARGARTSAATNEAVSNVKGTTGSAFVLRNGVWHYDWSTKGIAAGYLYRLGVRLDDGTTHYVTVGLR